MYPRLQCKDTLDYVSRCSYICMCVHSTDVETSRFLQLNSAKRACFDWLEAKFPRRVGLRFVSMVSMIPSVMTPGMQKTPQLSVDSLDTVIKVCMLIMQHLCCRELPASNSIIHIPLSLSLSLSLPPFHRCYCSTISILWFWL